MNGPQTPAGASADADRATTAGPATSDQEDIYGELAAIAGRHAAEEVAAATAGRQPGNVA